MIRFIRDPQPPYTQFKQGMVRDVGSALTTLFLGNGDAVDAAEPGVILPPAQRLLPAGSVAENPVATLTGTEVLQTRGVVSGARNREYPIEEHGTVYRARSSMAGATMTGGQNMLTINPYTIVLGDVGKWVMGRQILTQDIGRVIPGYTFTDADIGKTVGIKGPGVGSDTGVFSTTANDGVLVATIVSVSGGSAVLSTTATQACSGLCPWVCGFNNDAAVAAAVAQCTADYAADGVAGEVTFPGGDFIVSASSPTSSGVSYGAKRRDNTRVFVVKITADADNTAASSWIRRAAASVRYNHLSITQLTLIGTFLAASSAYSSDMKMIHIDTTDSSSVTWCRIVDNPSTALGYDDSTTCELAHNIIIRAGRLARPGTSGSSGGAGGSAIGVALGAGDVSMWIHHNRLIGSLASGMGNTDAGATGRSGINIEASAATPLPPLYGGQGVTIEFNIIEGYYNGIVDGASTGGRIVNNIIRKCVHGIKAGSNGVSYGRISRDGLIAQNDIADLFTWGGQYAIGISINSAPGTAVSGNAAIDLVYGRTRVTNNTIRRVKDGVGMALLASGSRTLLGLVVDNNTIADCDLSGLRMVGAFVNLQLTNNTFISNGRLSTAGNKAPIRFDSGVTWTGGRFSGNQYLDPESSPTQDATYTVQGPTPAVLTNVWAADKVLALINGTVANLPAASAAYAGFRTTVVDGNNATPYTTANVGTTVTAGGTAVVPVFCNGTNWVIG